MKSKGARLTTEISLPGRFVVFVPHGEGLGVSRRLEDAERDRLRDIVKAIAPKKGGVIVRTAAEGASDEDVERDLVFLQRLWKSIEANAEKAKAPALVYQEAELPLRVTRDLFTGDFEKAVIDDERTHKRIVGYLKKTSPHMVDRVIRYREKTPLFEQTGVEDAIQSTLSRRVDLPSGGYLVFDYAEAFTVIDVNTGRFVGSRSKSSTGRLEDTITANNLEAVKEVVHQLRLRDIGGIIVIDFIDMGSPKNRATVEEALKNELERDRTKTYVVEISPLGLVEMTRQNVTEGPREILTQKCPTCAGDGIVLSTHSAAIDAERRLRALAAGSKRGVEAYRVEMEENVASHVIGPGALRLAEIERLSKRRFFIEGKAGAPLDHFKVIAEGKLVDLAPKAPVEEGAEIRIELVEIGTPRRGRGHGQARRPVRLRRRRVEARRQEGEGPRRARARRGRVRDARPGCDGQGRRSDHGRVRGREADARRAQEDDGHEDEVPKIEAPASAVEKDRSPLPRQPKRQSRPSPRRSRPTEEPDCRGEARARRLPMAQRHRRSERRRGSRGGRNRRKKPAAAVAAENGEPPAEQVPKPEPQPQRQPQRQRQPKPKPDGASTATIHVPSADLGTDGDNTSAAEGEQPTPKKRTRRGSRGGRNRRRKPAAAGTAPEAKSEPSSG